MSIEMFRISTGSRTIDVGSLCMLKSISNTAIVYIGYTNKHGLEVNTLRLEPCKGLPGYG